MEGAFLEVFPVLRGGVVAWATGVFVGDVDVLAGEPSGDPGEERQLLPEELDARFWRWAGTFAGRSAEW